MSASFTIAARNNGFTKAEAREATLASVSAYRTAMAEFAEMGQMDIWYAHLSEQQLMAAIKSFAATQKETDKKQKKASKEEVKAAKKAAQKARTRDSLQALSKLGELVDGRYRIVSQPPIVVPARDFQAAYGMSLDELQQAVHEQFRAYRSTLQDDRRHLLERFEIIDMARKVVGVGSVGTRAFIVLLQGGTRGSAVPAGQGSDGVRARRSSAEESLQAARRTGRPGSADDAGRQRHLPRMDEGRAGEAATSTGASCAT